MTSLTVPARFVELPLTKSAEASEQQLRDHQIRSQQARAAARRLAAVTTSLDGLPDDLHDAPPHRKSAVRASLVGSPDRSVTSARRFMRHRKASLAALSHPSQRVRGAQKDDRAQHRPRIGLPVLPDLFDLTGGTGSCSATPSTGCQLRSSIAAR